MGFNNRVGGVSPEEMERRREFVLPTRGRGRRTRARISAESASAQDANVVRGSCSRVDPNKIDDVVSHYQNRHFTPAPSVMLNFRVDEPPVIIFEVFQSFN